MNFSKTSSLQMQGGHADKLKRDLVKNYLDFSLLRFIPRGILFLDRDERKSHWRRIHIKRDDIRKSRLISFFFRWWEPKKISRYVSPWH